MMIAMAATIQGPELTKYTQHHISPLQASYGVYVVNVL